MAGQATLQHQNSPLLRLPPEIRNSIYTYALTEQENVPMYRHWQDNDNSAPQTHAKGPDDHFLQESLYWKPPALLSTCRQTRIEGASIYYSGNSFQLTGMHWNEQLRRWFNILGPTNVRSLRQVRIDPHPSAKPTLELVVELLQLWKDFKEAGVEFEKEVLYMWIKIWGPMSCVHSSGLFPFKDHVGWRSLCQIEGGHIMMEGLVEDGSGRLNYAFETAYKMLE